MWTKIKNFFKELWLRWRSKSPWIFRIIQRTATFFGSLAGLVLLLESLDVELPGFISWAGSKIIIISTVLTWLVAKLPVDEDRASPEVKKVIAENKPEMDMPE